MLATFDEGHLRGKPAFTRRAHGKGNSLYLGTRLDDADLAAILDGLSGELGLKAPMDVPPGIEVTLREKGGKSFLFLLNHSAKPVRVPLGKRSGRELLSGKKAKTSWLLPAYDVAVIEG